MYYIYFHNWWDGFFNGNNGNTIQFFKELFKYCKFKNSVITNNIKNANVIIEAGKPNDNIINNDNIIYKINFIGEPVLPCYEKYDIVLTGINRINNIIDLPVSVMYILCNNLYSILDIPRNITTIPNKFCCFVVSNPNSEVRNKMFRLLNNYKKVDSGGRYMNNIGNIIINSDWWSPNYINFIKQYKFMICFENTKMETYSTEKIVNTYLSHTIPIYWSSNNIKNIFNIDSMLFLEDETDISFNKIINKIIELDTDDQKYLEFINRPIFTEHNRTFWKDNYSYSSLGNKIDNLLNKIQ